MCLCVGVEEEMRATELEANAANTSSSESGVRGGGGVISDLQDEEWETRKKVRTVTRRDVERRLERQESN